MTYGKALVASSLVALVTACGGGGGGLTGVPSGPNVVPLTVNGTTCGSGSGAYLNKPCVSVTVCMPGTSTCAVVDDVLLDTGSYGLRIFKQVLPFSLPLSTSGSATIAECIQYVDGSSDWGPVASADVVLGGEAAISIAVQVIDAAFGPPPPACPSPESSPATARYQGILGVGPFPEDCGSGCATSAANGIYFACSGGTCSGTNVQVSNQVPNPVAKLAADNNGVIVELPPVPLGGASTARGALILGIDTQPNNSSAGKTAYPGGAATGEIVTSFEGVTTSSFLDTGSNAFFFAPPSSGALPPCPAPNSSWYCPAQITSFTATNFGASGSPSGAVSFSIGNTLSLVGTGHAVFIDLGGSMPGGSAFDFGLPFFLGRTVYVGIQGKNSHLGTGPYYAY